MSTDWTLASELCKAAGADSIVDALAQLGLAPPGELLSAIDEAVDWVRGGAETFLFPFSIRLASGGERKFIIKAFVPGMSPIPLEEQMERMFERRRVIEGAGVTVPKVYYRGNGIWIEDYVSFTLKDVLIETLDSRDYHRQVKLIRAVSALAAVLDEYGFQTISLCSDLRSDGATVYMIDFGADLGEPLVTAKSTHNFDSVLAWLRRIDSRLAEGAADLAQNSTRLKRAE